VEFDRQSRAITQSHASYAMVGNTADYYWSREFTSELLDQPEVADDP
jgi:hypothetical protein